MSTHSLGEESSWLWWLDSQLWERRCENASPRLLQKVPCLRHCVWSISCKTLLLLRQWLFQKWSSPKFWKARCEQVCDTEANAPQSLWFEVAFDRYLRPCSVTDPLVERFRWLLATSRFATAFSTMEHGRAISSSEYRLPCLCISNSHVGPILLSRTSKTRTG